MLNDDEIITSVPIQSDPVDDETDEDDDNNNESSKGPSNAGAFSLLETAMEWYEQQSECCPARLLLLKRIRDLVAKKRKCTMWLVTLTDVDLSSNPGEGMDVCQRIVPSRNGGTDTLQSVLSQNWDGAEPNRTGTCMVFKATTNNRHTLCPDEFRGPRSDTASD
ncbi:uncharacterized protein TNCV_3498531 [Trichonephila clavipes]|nr:uncharacterized protein TNCV_3498531 [Trichonephila clavipes]